MPKQPEGQMTKFPLLEEGARRGPFAAGSENQSDLTGCVFVVVSTTIGAFRAMGNSITSLLSVYSKGPGDNRE